MADVPAGKWTTEEAIFLAWKFGVFAAIANVLGARDAATWARAVGLDVEDSICALRTMYSVGWKAKVSGISGGKS